MATHKNLITKKTVSDTWSYIDRSIYNRSHMFIFRGIGSTLSKLYSSTIGRAWSHSERKTDQAAKNALKNSQESTHSSSFSFSFTKAPGEQKHIEQVIQELPSITNLLPKDLSNKKVLKAIESKLLGLTDTEQEAILKVAAMLTEEQLTKEKSLPILHSANTVCTQYQAKDYSKPPPLPEPEMQIAILKVGAKLTGPQTDTFRNIYSTFQAITAEKKPLPEDPTLQIAILDIAKSSPFKILVCGVRIKILAARIVQNVTQKGTQNLDLQKAVDDFPPKLLEEGNHHLSRFDKYKRPTINTPE